MNLITAITSDPNQKMNLILDDGSRLTLNLKYFSNQQGWFYSIVYGSISYNLRRIVTSPNMLRAFRNIIPFGLACITSDGYEPLAIDSFSSGYASLYLLNQDDLTLVESLIAG